MKNKLKKAFCIVAIAGSAPLMTLSAPWFYSELTTPTEEKGGYDWTIPAGGMFLASTAIFAGSTRRLYKYGVEDGNNKNVGNSSSGNEPKL